MNTFDDYSISTRIQSQMGGTDNRVVRLASDNTWQDAEPADSSSGLGFLFYKQNGYYLEPGRVVYELFGLTVGATYYLGAGGILSPTPASPEIIVGQAISTTKLFFYPTSVNTGSGGPAGTAFLDAPDRIDESSDAQYFYFGWDNISGSWLVQRQARDTSQSQSATTGHASLNDAWTNRATLTYT